MYIKYQPGANIPGLKFEFALETKYPTSSPEYYGTCDDSVKENCHKGVLEIIEDDLFEAVTDEQGNVIQEADENPQTAQQKFEALRAAELQTRQDMKVNSKLAEIKEGFLKLENETGTYDCSLGFTVDCRRKDIDNVRTLKETLAAGGVASLDFRDHDNNEHTLSLVELETLYAEMIAHGIQRYQTKWQMEEAAKAATTPEEFDAIHW